MKAHLTLLTLAFLCAMFGIASGAVAFWAASGLFTGLLLFLTVNDASMRRRDNQVPTMRRRRDE